MKIQKKCPVCNSYFEPRSYAQKYCSPKCARDKQTADNYEAIKKRNAINAKYNKDLYAAFHYECAVCHWHLPMSMLEQNKSIGHGCQMHHIKPVSEGGTNDEKNLILLCPNCHKMAHSGALTPDTLKRLTFTKEQAHAEALNVDLKTKAYIAEQIDLIF